MPKGLSPRYSLPPYPEDFIIPSYRTRTHTRPPVGAAPESLHDVGKDVLRIVPGVHALVSDGLCPEPVQAYLGLHTREPPAGWQVDEEHPVLVINAMNQELLGKKVEENKIYDPILHLKWATDYGDVYEELVEQNYAYPIHKPSSVK